MSNVNPLDIENERYTLKSLYGRIGKLEDHLINLILPIQGINRVLHDPNERQDIRGLMNQISTTQVKMDEKFLTSYKKILNNFNDQIMTLSRNLQEVNTTLAEIKYIGKRLLNIENILKEFTKEKFEKKIELDVSIAKKEFSGCVEQENCKKIGSPVESKKIKAAVRKVVKERRKNERS